ncbi:MAG: hypothetical protein ACR2OD_11400 [Gaiellaceae bacterium]
MRITKRLRAGIWPVALVGLAVGLIAFALTNRSDVPGPFVDVLAEDAAAQQIELTGETVSGEPFSLASLRGRPVLINVWASW